MASLLQNLCVGQYQACLLVMTRLGANCTPLEGPNDQVRTSCFASVDAQPQFDDGAEYGRRSSNGLRCFYVRDCNHFKQIDLTFQIITWDVELIELATGSDVLTGKTGTPWVGKSMGFGIPGADESCSSGVSVEVYTKAAYGTGGFCVSTASGAPTWVRHLFPFCRLTMGQVTLDDSADGILLNMTGFGLSNPNWGNGPSNDWPASIDMAAASPYAAVFTNIKPDPTCGYVSPTPAPPAIPVVFNDAAFWIDAASDNNASLATPNLGTGGVALNAQYGSAAGGDTGDPKWLPSGATIGGHYVYFPGTLTANSLQTPNAAPLQITGDITMVGDLTTSNWVPGTAGRLGGKESMYDFHIGAGLGFVYADSGSVVRSATSSVVVPFAANARGQVAMTKKGGISTNDVKFWYRATSADAWIQLGTAISSGGLNIGSNTTPFYLGNDGTSVQPLEAIMHRFLLYNTAGAAGEPATASPVLDFNPSLNVVNETNLTITATSGHVFTVNRAASGRRTVVVSATGRARWLMGTNDFLQVNNNALLNFTHTEDFTALVIRRTWVAGDAAMFKRDNTSGIWMLYRDGTGVLNRVLCTNNVDLFSYASITPALGTMYMQTLVRDVTADLIRNYIGSSAAGTTNDTTTGTLTGTANLFIGQTGGTGPGFSDMEVLAAGLWRRVLTPAEIATIATYYGV